MNLSAVITRVADDGNVNSNITSVSDRIVREINRISQEIWQSHRWSFRWRNYRIVTDVDVNSGTATATNGSYSVTGTAAAFLSSHVNWHISFTADSIQNWYKVRSFTSTSQIELDVPYQGTSGSGKSYILRHFDYVLPTEPWDLGSVIVTADNRPLIIVEPMGSDVLCPVPLNNGYPTAASIYDSDDKPTVYSTGTVSGTINTTTVTGSGSTWLGNIYPGDILVIGSYSYTVRSVDSNTQITLYNYQQTTSTSASYTITRQFGRILRLMYPAVNRYTLDIRALRNYAPLVNNNDSNELLYRMPNAIILKAAAMELKQQNDQRAAVLEKDADIAVNRAKAEDDALTQKEPVAAIFTYRSAGFNRFVS